MNKTEIVPFAMDVLSALDEATCLSARDLHTQFPELDQTPLLTQLASAGIITEHTSNRFTMQRPLAEWTSLELLTAIWGTASETPVIQWLYRSGDASLVSLESHLCALENTGCRNDEGK